ncbi:MAG: HEAT repeat domain-containing protein [candidate division WOR-3 bacterium]
MWFLGGRPKEKKPTDDQAKRLPLAAAWRMFETVELHRPELLAKLREFTELLKREAPSCHELLRQAGARGTAQDVNLLFTALELFPSPPSGSFTLPDEAGFLWQNAEAELPGIGHVANTIRVAEARRQQESRERARTRLERRVAALTQEVMRHEPETASGLKARQELASAQQELKAALAEEREILTTIDEEMAKLLSALTELYRLHETALQALAGVRSAEGFRQIVKTLSGDSPVRRGLALRALRLANWTPTETSDRLWFWVVAAKTGASDAEQNAALAQLDELILSTTDIRELTEVIDPVLTAEGLAVQHGKLLAHLCKLTDEAALSYVVAAIGSGHEPPESKVLVLNALARLMASGKWQGTGEGWLQQAVELLIQALDDLVMEVRVAAAGALATLPDPADEKLRERALDRLVFALRDGDVLVRTAAANALSEKRYPRAGERLAAILRSDPLPSARESAALALASDFAPNPVTTEALIQALDDEDAAVRKAAAEALAAQGWAPPDRTSRIRFLCARQNWKELRQLGRDAAPILIPRLRDRDPEVRLEVTRLLGAIGAKEAVRELAIALSDARQEIRAAAASALSLLEDPSALPALKSALAKEGFREVRSEMERAIRRLERKSPPA